MRLALLGFAPLLLAYAVLTAQQAPSQPLAPQDGSTAPSAPQSPSTSLDAKQPDHTDDAIARGQAKAAKETQKDKAKADAKAQKHAEKDKKEAEEEAKFLKLQDNEIVVASFDAEGNPVKLPPCSRKDKLCQQKRKELLKQKKVGLNVQNGTLTVDGWTGKARLNYDIKLLQFLYVSVPGYGTIVASPDRFPNATEVKDALDGQTLTITTGDDHTVQLTSEVVLSGKQKRSMFYSVDRVYSQPGGFPSMGYGFVNKAPYVWPATLPATEEQKRLMAKAPELPKGMEARAVRLPCQVVVPGASPRTASVNGVVVPQPACRPGDTARTPGAYSIAERPTDGSGAASTGIAENRSH